MSVVRSVMSGMAARRRVSASSTVSRSPPAVHGAQHLGIDVLDGHVQIMQHLFVARHGRDKRVGDALRISVQQADPLDALHGVQRIQKLRDLHPAAVRAEGRDVLRHNDELFTPSPARARFGHNIRMVRLRSGPRMSGMAQ